MAQQPGQILASQVLAAVLAHMGGPFVWGQSDCFCSAAAVFAALTGRRLTCPQPYGDAAGGRAALRAALAQIGALAGQAGLVPCAPCPGAIGLVALPTGGLAFGICVELGLWAVKSDPGFGFVRQARRCWRAIEWQV